MTFFLVDPLFLGGAHAVFSPNGHLFPAVHHPDAIRVHLHLLTKSFTQYTRAAKQDATARRKAEAPVNG